MSNSYLHTDQYYTKKTELESFISTETEWKWVPNFFVSSSFNPEIFKDDFVKALDEKFNGKLSLYKIPAKSVYKWHVDTFHKWSINMVLETFDSHTLFLKNQVDTILYFEELVYKPHEWVIFNTQNPHTVVNLDDRDRILVTYRKSFIDDNSYSYQEVVDWYSNDYIKIGDVNNE